MFEVDADDFVAEAQNGFGAADRWGGAAESADFDPPQDVVLFGLGIDHRQIAAVVFKDEKFAVGHDG